MMAMSDIKIVDIVSLKELSKEEMRQAVGGATVDKGGDSDGIVCSYYCQRTRSWYSPNCIKHPDQN
jgi:hypothetical protein